MGSPAASLCSEIVSASWSSSSRRQSMLCVLHSPQRWTLYKSSATAFEILIRVNVKPCLRSHTRHRHLLETLMSARLRGGLSRASRDGQSSSPQFRRHGCRNLTAGTGLGVGQNANELADRATNVSAWDVAHATLMRLAIVSYPSDPHLVNHCVMILNSPGSTRGNSSSFSTFKQAVKDTKSISRRIH